MEVSYVWLLMLQELNNGAEKCLLPDDKQATPLNKRFPWLSQDNKIRIENRLGVVNSGRLLMHPGALVEKEAMLPSDPSGKDPQDLLETSATT